MESKFENNIRKDLIVREWLAIKRTYMANQKNLLSYVLLAGWIINFIRQKEKITESEKQIEHYKSDYLS